MVRRIADVYQQEFDATRRIADVYSFIGDTFRLLYRVDSSAHDSIRRSSADYLDVFDTFRSIVYGFRTKRRIADVYESNHDSNRRMAQDYINTHDALRIIYEDYQELFDVIRNFVRVSLLTLTGASPTEK